MKRLLVIPFIFIISISCNKEGKEQTKKTLKTEFEEVKNDDYELSKPTKNIKSVLVLFGGYPEKAEDIKREFKILEIAKENRIAVVLMNYNQKLWLDENEKQILAEQLQNIFKENNLPRTKSYFGGFSSGGNLALLISDFLTQQNSDLRPKGVFIIDSPVDLIALYKSSEKNIEQNFSEPSVQESTWLIKTLGRKFGNPHDSISSYEKHSVYTSETDNIDNLKHLRNTKIRFYTEPDTIWWKENRMASFDQMNAFYLKQLYETLQELGFGQVEYIPTENKGYRANGERHPHSWAIVDKKELIKWMTE